MFACENSSQRNGFDATDGVDQSWTMRHQFLLNDAMAMSEDLYQFALKTESENFTELGDFSFASDEPMGIPGNEDFVINPQMKPSPIFIPPSSPLVSSPLLSSPLALFSPLSSPHSPSIPLPSPRGFPTAFLGTSLSSTPSTPNFPPLPSIIKLELDTSSSSSSRSSCKRSSPTLGDSQNESSRPLVSRKKPRIQIQKSQKAPRRVIQPSTNPESKVHLTTRPVFGSKRLTNYSPQVSQQTQFIKMSMEDNKLAFYGLSDKECKFAIFYTGHKLKDLKDKQITKNLKENVAEIQSALQTDESLDVDMKETVPAKKPVIRLSSNTESELDSTKWKSSEKRPCGYCSTSTEFKRPHLETHITKCHTDNMALPYQCKLCTMYDWNRSYDQAKKHIQELSCPLIAELKCAVIEQHESEQHDVLNDGGVLVADGFCLGFEENGGTFKWKLLYPVYDKCLRYRCTFKKSRMHAAPCNSIFSTKSALDNHFKAHNICNCCLKLTDRTNKKLFRLHRDTGHQHVFFCEGCVTSYIASRKEHDFAKYEAHMADQHLRVPRGQWKLWGKEKHFGGGLDDGERKKKRRTV